MNMGKVGETTLISSKFVSSWLLNKIPHDSSKKDMWVVLKLNNKVMGIANLYAPNDVEAKVLMWNFQVNSSQR